MIKILPPSALVAACALVLAGCAPASDAEPAAAVVASEEVEIIRGPSVVATTTIIGSVVSDILVCAVGNDSSLTVMMPVGADPHDVQASSGQVALMTTADLVVANGLFLEEGLLSTLVSVDAENGNVLELAELLEPLPFAYESEKDDDGHGHSDPGHVDDDDDDEHGHGDLDPHFWLDMSRMAQAAELMGTELTAATGDDVYAQCGVSVADDIRVTETEVVALLAGISEGGRVLVTDHDAFAYFAQAYGFRVVGVVVPGGSTLADPSSKELADLVRTIRSEGVPALFANTATPSAVAEAIAAEVGQGVTVVPLFVGSIGGPGSGAESYREMMVANATLIAQALAD